MCPVGFAVVPVVSVVFVVGGNSRSEAVLLQAATRSDTRREGSRLLEAT